MPRAQFLNSELDETFSLILVRPMNALPKICTALTVVFITTVSLWAAPPMPRSWPDQGPVRTEAAAISIAIKLSPIYGADRIAREKR